LIVGRKAKSQFTFHHCDSKSLPASIDKLTNTDPILYLSIHQYSRRSTSHVSEIFYCTVSWLGRRGIDTVNTDIPILLGGVHKACNNTPPINIKSMRLCSSFAVLWSHLADRFSHKQTKTNGSTSNVPAGPKTSTSPSTTAVPKVSPPAPSPSNAPSAPSNFSTQPDSPPLWTHSIAPTGSKADRFRISKSSPLVSHLRSRTTKSKRLWREWEIRKSRSCC